MGINEFFAALPPWAGSLPNWITASGVVALLTVYVKRELGLRRLDIQADRVQIEAKKVRNADEADIRDHYADEVQQLRDAIERQSKRHNDALTAQEERHNTAMIAQEERFNRILAATEERQVRCEQERERLADRVTKLQQELTGVMDKVRMNSADQVVLLADSGEPVPPHALAAAKRIVARSNH
jgi:hypothetical protein